MYQYPPWSALVAFEAAARRLSFLDAAGELNVTPSAVSHQIRSLEEFLEIKVFHRLDKSVTLTTAGQSYYKMIRPALKKISDATEQIVTKAGGGVLTVTATPFFTTRWLLPRLYRFQEAHPKLEVRIHLAAEVVDFSRSDADVGIRLGNGALDKLKAFRLLTESQTPVCSQKLIKKDTSAILASDLKQFVLLGVDSCCDDWPYWFKKLGIDEENIKRGPEFQNTAQAIEAAVSGLGMALTDRRFVTPELESGLLVTPIKETIEKPNSFYLVYPKENDEVPKIKVFRDWILSEIEQTHSKG